MFIVPSEDSVPSQKHTNIESEEGLLVQPLSAASFQVVPEHGLEDGLQGDLQVQFVGAGELHVDGLIPGDEVAGVVHAFYPDSILIHDVCAV